MQEKVRVLFVCMGNICRSPTAEGVFRDLVSQLDLHSKIESDSAGTHAYHIGEQPDRRAQLAAKERGIDLSDLRARHVSLTDYETFDYILAMDNDNYNILISQSPAHAKPKIKLFMDFAKRRSEQEVPDPYYGGQRGFDIVYDMVEDASKGLLEDIKKRFLTE
jgi:protein-tyrosine phosphatase